MSIFYTGYLLLGRDESSASLWFVFHHDEGGALAVDLATPHPEISHRIFRTALAFEDERPETEKAVLLGGPEDSDSAMLILYGADAAGKDSHQAGEEFAFSSYRLKLLPGKPPAITGTDNRPSKIELKKQSDFLIVLGFRAWGAGVLEDEIAKELWSCLPATPEIVFHSPRAERLKKARARIN